MAVIGNIMLAEEIEALLAAQRPVSDSTYLATGGGVSLVSGLTFRVSAGQAFIRGALYAFPQADVVLGAADGTNPRFDLIVADSATLTYHAIAGTPAASPAVPDIDPLTQLVVTQILVPAAAATIATIVKTSFYSEATPETVTTSGASIVGNSTSEPLSGTKCINATTAAADAWAKTTIAAPVTVASANQLIVNIKSKAAWHNSRSVQVRFLLAGVQKGIPVAIADKLLGFVSSQTSTYQQLVIPIGAFNLPAGTTADAIEFRVKGSGGSNIGWRIDDVTLESSDVISVPSPTPRATSTVSGSLRTTVDSVDPQVETRLPMSTTWAKAAGLDVDGFMIGRHPPRLKAGTIAYIEVIPDGTVVSGTIKVRKGTKAGYPGSMADITGGADLTLNAGSGVQTFTTLTGWTKAYVVGDIFEVELSAFSGTGTKSLLCRIVPVE